MYALAQLQAKLHGGDLREYLFSDYLVLHAQTDDVINFLSIKHHHQPSFDIQSPWLGN
ncbi:MAG: hypothetical protein OEV15_04530 [Gallionella sp.]|nr:hypothetical protein [Gallionella sp.]